jgi:hypothetical protein
MSGDERRWAVMRVAGAQKNVCERRSVEKY